MQTPPEGEAKQTPVEKRATCPKVGGMPATPRPHTGRRARDDASTRLGHQPNLADRGDQIHVQGIHGFDFAVGDGGTRRRALGTESRHCLQCGERCDWPPRAWIQESTAIRQGRMSHRRRNLHGAEPGIDSRLVRSASDTRKLSSANHYLGTIRSLARCRLARATRHAMLRGARAR